MADESRIQAKTRKGREDDVETYVRSHTEGQEVLRQRLGIDSVSDVLRRNRLKWFGHVERKNDDDWVKAIFGNEKMAPSGRVSRVVGRLLNLSF